MRDLGNTAKSAHLTSMKGAGENLELVQADLLDDDASWQKVVTGCTYVFHMASPSSLGFPTTRRRRNCSNLPGRGRLAF